MNLPKNLGNRLHQTHFGLCSPRQAVTGLLKVKLKASQPSVKTSSSPLVRPIAPVTTWNRRGHWTRKMSYSCRTLKLSKSSSLMLAGNFCLKFFAKSEDSFNDLHANNRFQPLQHMPYISDAKSMKALPNSSYSSHRVFSILSYLFHLSCPLHNQDSGEQFAMNALISQLTPV